MSREKGCSALQPQEQTCSFLCTRTTPICFRYEVTHRLLPQAHPCARQHTVFAGHSMPAAGLPLSICAGAAGLRGIPEGWQGWVHVGAFTQQRASVNISCPFEIKECKVFPPGGARRTLTCRAERWSRRLWAWGYSPCWGAEWQRGGGAA